MSRAWQKLNGCICISRKFKNIHETMAGCIWEIHSLQNASSSEVSYLPGETGRILYILFATTLGSKISIMRNKNADEVIPGAHHSPGVRCLDSGREVLIGHCGQSSEVGEPTVISCSMGPCRERLGHSFCHLYAERKMNLHLTRKSCIMLFFFLRNTKNMKY